jgi:hypothetical protein
MEVSRAGEAGGRQGSKLVIEQTRNHPKELFGAWVLIFETSGGEATGRARD